MDVDPVSLKFFQPMLFDEEQGTVGVIELFPKVWGAAEALTDPDVNNRRQGLDSILELNAARHLPLIAYLLCTRLNDPDIELRKRFIGAIAQLLGPGKNGETAQQVIRHVLKHYLGQMDAQDIKSLLEVVETDTESVSQVAIVIKACPKAGEHLAVILADRSQPLAIRNQAVCLIGKIGYVDALPIVDRLATKLEARVNGQQLMPFTQPDTSDEVKLLPAVRYTQEMLRAP
jgi:HEAT repeat protein